MSCFMAKLYSLKESKLHSNYNHGETLLSKVQYHAKAVLKMNGISLLILNNFLSKAKMVSLIDGVFEVVGFCNLLNMALTTLGLS